MSLVLVASFPGHMEPPTLSGNKLSAITWEWTMHYTHTVAHTYPRVCCQSPVFTALFQLLQTPRAFPHLGPWFLLHSGLISRGFLTRWRTGRWRVRVRVRVRVDRRRLGYGGWGRRWRGDRITLNDGGRRGRWGWRGWRWRVRHKSLSLQKEEENTLS